MTAPDHPRSRGVYVDEAGRALDALGSSPLARGLRRRVRLAGWGPGIIPARAGFTIRTRGPTTRIMDHPRSRGVYELPPPAGRKPPGIIPARAGFTSWPTPPSPTGRDHPRSRGVYLHARIHAVYDGGSSPLARGLRVGAFWPSASGGIIPARAGFTSSSSSSSPLRRDHPRSRGVYMSVLTSLLNSQGSSPLARGLPPKPLPRWRLSRIIPARAGFTRRGLGGCAPCGDHPRSRGVYVCRHAVGPPGSGSSPLARGLHDGFHRIGLPAGIIPARAGFTSPCGVPHSTGLDHPRSRGVYVLMRAPPGWRVGSSPLARGLPLLGDSLVHLGGIIPARAGFTSSKHPRTSRQADHPRSRGVYHSWRLLSIGGSGSSPLARGLQQPVEPAGAGGGIIPARAGFTVGGGPAMAITPDHPRSRGVYPQRAGD